ncbi:hypothetical protein [Haliangium sp. UPWRP_2]|uniref:hypothetical protein n=1 Tax=Haliangium sp. UPWRP_2 TaxID=1931276 RepID=UPI001304A1F9|nr:hypothetical protein [Haliangium sp. UPWRP_2]
MPILMVTRREQHAVARTKLAERVSKDAAGVLEISFFGMLLQVCGLGVLLIGPFALIWGKRSDLHVFGPMAIAGLASFPMRSRYRRQQREDKRRLDEALSPLAAQIAGRSVNSIEEQVAWLNASWAAESEYADLFCSRIHGGLAGVVRGYSVLVDIEPCSYADEASSSNPRISLYVSAAVPEAKYADSPRTHEFSKRLQSAGYDLHIVPYAGLRACATPETYRMLYGDLARVPNLVPILEDMVELAMEYGFAPVQVEGTSGP